MINHSYRTLDIIITSNFQNKFDVTYIVLLNTKSFATTIIQ